MQRRTAFALRSVGDAPERVCGRDDKDGAENAMDSCKVGCVFAMERCVSSTNRRVPARFGGAWRKPWMHPRYVEMGRFRPICEPFPSIFRWSPVLA